MNEPNLELEDESIPTQYEMEDRISYLMQSHPNTINKLFNDFNSAIDKLSEDLNLLKNKTMKTKVINIKLSESNILNYWIQKLEHEGYKIISQDTAKEKTKIKVRNVKAFLRGEKVLEDKVLIKTIQKTLMENEEQDTVTLIAEIKSEVK